MNCRLPIVPRAVLAMLLLSGVPYVALAEEARYVGGFEALPLAEGLVEIAGAGVIFDTPDGRIVERFASGGADATAIAAFYTATLPALGWRPIAPLVFSRDEETLSITVYPPDTNKRTTVRFSLAPR